MVAETETETVPDFTELEPDTPVEVIIEGDSTPTEAIFLGVEVLNNGEVKATLASRVHKSHGDWFRWGIYRARRARLFRRPTGKVVRIVSV